MKFQRPTLTTSLNRRTLLWLSGGALLTSCSRSKQEEASLADLPVLPKEDSQAAPDGSRMIAVDEKHKVWTQRIGSGAVKVLTLHGGPGAAHNYLRCFEKFLPQAGIELYYYDQLGCGLSDKPEDSSLWTLDRYTGEVERVRTALNLENFILCGHSFGAMLAIEYALKYPGAVKKLVLSNMTASAIRCDSYMHQLRQALAPDVQAKLEKLEDAGQFENPAYQSTIQDVLYAKHRCRLNPVPDAVEQTSKQLSRPVYNTMHGPNEFLITGNLKTWDRWIDLMRIQVPVLAIGSRWDQVDPTDVEKVSHNCSRGKYAYCANGSSMCMWDDQQSYFDQLIPFLKA